MYKKKGSYCRETPSGNPVIQNLNGQAYEVSYVAAFIWDKLDGKTSLNEVEEEIFKHGDMSKDKLRAKVKNILTELEKVALLSSESHEVSN